MEIKVKYQGQVVGLIDFKVFSAIEKMRDLGYWSFSVRSQVSKYEYFVVFRNEDTEEVIRIYPDKSFMKTNDCYDCKVLYKESNTIKYIVEYYIHNKIVEESEQK